MGVEELVRQLQSEPVSVADARRPAADGGLPDKRGLYAWWMRPRAIPGVEGPSHPEQPLELLYVGIAPSRDGSSATIRSRVRRQHLGGNISASTFRQSLAALLIAQQRWRTHRPSSRTRLVRESNHALTRWQEEHLKVSWVSHRQPRAVEGSVIKAMEPPLNLGENREHSMHPHLTALRKALRDSAGAGGSPAPPA